MKFNNLKLLLIALLLIVLPQCAKEDKKPQDLTFNELKQQTLSALKENKHKNAIKPLEALVAQHSERQDLGKYKLLLADSYFNTGELVSAYQMYEHFTDFYPSDKNSEYAAYQAIKSKFYQTLRIDCDQSETEQTINLCKKYLKNTLNNKYQKDVEDIQRTCERKLIDKEVYVYNFYLRKGKFKSAKNRLAYLKDNFLDKDSELNPRILFLEAKLAQKEKNDSSLTEKIEELMEQYPESHFTRMAQGLTTKNKFIF
ncbi:MAG: outer membrane protein assembly factor BamD [bacterium]